MLSLRNAEFITDPYFIGCAKGVFDEAVYARLVEAFPDLVSDYVAFGGGNKKLSLSEVNNPDGYCAFLERSQEWQGVYKWIKSPRFISYVLTTIDYRSDRQFRFVDAANYKSRFEFSAIPADGGCLRPHTDIPSKVVTLVIPICRPGEWEQSWGGGTDVLKPKDGTKPLQDYKADFSEFDVVHTYEYEPNQAVVFVKSEKSWHCVSPCRGPAGKFRKTITVNIERAK